MLDNWGGKLTWTLLINSILRQLEQLYTRQALSNHEEIAVAFATKKKLLQTGSKHVAPISPDLQAAHSKIASLEARVERQKTIIRNFEVQFALWTYNASIESMPAGFLDRPIPPVDRGQTDGS